MSSARKLKISVTLGADLLASIDRQAAAAGGSRSAMIEGLLRRAAQREALARLEESTAAYYDALTDGEKAAERVLSRASARAARRLVIDDSRLTSSRPRRRRARRSVLRRSQLYWARLDRRQPVLVVSSDARNARASDRRASLTLERE